MRTLAFRLWLPITRTMRYDFGALHFTEGYYGKCVIEQYIGRTDCINKKIYEGDIIEWYYKLGIIEFNDSGFYARLIQKGPAKYKKLCEYSVGHVLGNIHQNPELVGDHNESNCE